MIGASPPGPFRCGSATCSVNAVAAAASNALPPRSSTAMPTWLAIQCVLATTPNVPAISGRVVNMRRSPLRGGQASATLARRQCEDAMLVLVVGPSGAGKDTLLEAARQALADDPRYRFVRRVITRPADAGGEAHEAVTDGGIRRARLRTAVAGAWVELRHSGASDRRGCCGRGQCLAYHHRRRGTAVSDTGHRGDRPRAGSCSPVGRASTRERSGRRRAPVTQRGAAGPCAGRDGDERRIAGRRR